MTSQHEITSIEEEERLHRLKLVDEFFAGAVSGAVSLIAGHPFDTLKTLQQSSSGSHSNLVELMRSMYMSGSRRYFRGLSVPLTSYAAVNSLFFGSYKNILHIVDPMESSIPCMAMSGFLAGGIQLSICVPVEVIKIQMQRQATNEACPTLRQMIKKIYCQRGLRGFYAGTSAHAMRDMPAGAIYFSSYTVICETFTQRFHVNTFVSSFIAGAMAGCFSWVTTMPLDVMKTRLQGGTDQSLRQSFNALRSIGFTSFFKGTSMVLVRAFLVNATVFSVYEVCIRFLRHRRITPDLSDDNSNVATSLTPKDMK